MKSTAEGDNEISEFLTDLKTMSQPTKKDNQMTTEAQLDRLTNQKYYNPYDILMLKPEAGDEEITKTYRNVSNSIL